MDDSVCGFFYSISIFLFHQSVKSVKVKSEAVTIESRLLQYVSVRCPKSDFGLLHSVTVYPTSIGFPSNCVLNLIHVLAWASASSYKIAMFQVYLHSPPHSRRKIVSYK